MTNISNYFPHDSNARNDDRLIAVRMKMGAEGYGIYFMVLERLREGKGYTCVRDYNIIAFDLRVAAEKVKAVVEDFGLFAFTEDRAGFYSETLAKRMQIKDERAEKLKNAANKRWGKTTEVQHVAEKENAGHIPCISHAHARDVQEKKEKKEKERKGEGERKEHGREFLPAKEKKDPAAPGDFSGDKKTEGPGPAEPAMGVAELERACAGHETWVEAVGTKNAIARPRVLEWLRAFRLHLEASGRTEETEREFKRYFANWTASEIRQGRTPVNAPQNAGKTVPNGKIDPTLAIQMALVRKYGANGRTERIAIGG